MLSVYSIVPLAAAERRHRGDLVTVRKEEGLVAEGNVLLTDGEHHLVLQSSEAERETELLRGPRLLG